MTNVMGTVRWVIRVSSLLSKALMSLVDAMVSVGILALRTRVELMDFLPKSRVNQSFERECFLRPEQRRSELDPKLRGLAGGGGLAHQYPFCYW